MLALLVVPVPLIADSEGTPLWQIGKPDNRSDEFALGPDGYAGYSRDGFFSS